MKYCGGGCTRDVFLIGRYAFKVPKLTSTWGMFLRGFLCNMQERAFSTLGRGYCPVVWHIPGGFLVVMRRAEPLSREEWFDLLDRLEADRLLFAVAERKQDSFGKLGGEIVAVDYGGGGGG